MDGLDSSLSLSQLWRLNPVCVCLNAVRTSSCCKFTEQLIVSVHGLQSSPAYRKPIAMRKLQRQKYSLKQSKTNLYSAFPKASQPHLSPPTSQPSLYNEESNTHTLAENQPMPPRRVLEVRLGDHDSQKWRVSLSEEAFQSFIARAEDTAHKVFSGGSLFSPLLFGKFFDPADAFPLWEFDSEVLLSEIRCVDWQETDIEYVLRAELPGTTKCEVEICGEKGNVLEISGEWRSSESEPKHWKAGRWWEHGYVRRIELPEDANLRKVEAYIDEDAFLEIKIPKNISNSNNVHRNGADCGAPGS